jgi:hypothetical protein
MEKENTEWPVLKEEIAVPTPEEAPNAAALQGRYL